jgi:hypothetical protein
MNLEVTPLFQCEQCKSGSLHSIEDTADH